MNLLLIHKVSVILFLLIYLVKTILLLSNQNETLAKITKVTKVPEMIISVLFLVTGVWMFVEIGAIKSMQIMKLVAVFLAIPLAIIGFKKQKKALALISLLLIIGSYGLAEMSRKQPYPSKSEIGGTKAEENDLGAVVYNGKGNCVSCHGDDGKKNFMGATDLASSKMDKPEIVEIVTKGRKNMASYKDILSSEEIDAVAEYVKKLQK